MKRIISIFCALLLMLALPLSSALAEPRYPARQSVVTDAAAVLSTSIINEITQYAQALEKSAKVKLHVLTVDFLDGLNADRYGETLRSKWNLGDNDLLLLLAIGEDSFGSYGGKDVNRLISQQVQSKLLSAQLEGPFLRQDYDGALAAYLPALNQEIAKNGGKAPDITGLFGIQKSAPAPQSTDWAEDWLRRWDDTHAQPKDESLRARVTEEDTDTGFSLGKVILTIFLLTVIFGDHGRRRHRGYGRRYDRRDGCGCGCAPFSSLLAALGLWKLWDKK